MGITGADDAHRDWGDISLNNGHNKSFGLGIGLSRGKGLSISLGLSLIHI